MDGAENNLPSFYLSRHYEVTGYYAVDEHTWVPDVLLVSTHVWDALTDQEQAWLREAARSSVAVQRRLWREASEHALAEVTAAGVEVVYPDKEPFRQAVEPMFESYRGSSIYPLLETIWSAR